MVFQTKGHFNQFLHCQFKENIVRLLYIPTYDCGNAFIVVNKFGKVALYNPDSMGLLHTFCLDLSNPYLRRMPNRRNEIDLLKCHRMHIIVDAIYAPDIRCVLFATTKSIVQCYDVGEIEGHNLGLVILPRKQFMNMVDGVSPVPLKNKGFVETHRILGLQSVPSCLEYYSAPQNKTGSGDTSNPKGSEGIKGLQNTAQKSKLLIGDVDGGVTIIEIDDPKFPFGKRKLRGTLFTISLPELELSGKVKSYKGHMDPVQQIRFLGQRQLVISCSRDRKFSLFCEDFTEISDSFIISLPKGIKCITYSPTLGIIGTGSEDAVVRIFNQFSKKMPQMELIGHRASIVGLEMLQVPSSEAPVLISFSEDLELRAWDTTTFACLQSLYLSFSPNTGSTIICKTPEFAKQAVVIHQPHFDADSKTKGPEKSGNGFILLLYCNSFAKLRLETNQSHWPFDFDQFLTELDDSVPKRIQTKNNTAKGQSPKNGDKNPMSVQLNEAELSEVKRRANKTNSELLDLRNQEFDNYEGFETISRPKMGMTSRATTTLCSIDTSTPYMVRMLRRKASIFDNLPLYDIPNVKSRPPEFYPKYL